MHVHRLYKLWHCGYVSPPITVWVRPPESSARRHQSPINMWTLRNGPAISPRSWVPLITCVKKGMGVRCSVRGMQPVMSSWGHSRWYRLVCLCVTVPVPSDEWARTIAPGITVFPGSFSVAPPSLLWYSSCVTGCRTGRMAFLRLGNHGGSRDFDGRDTMFTWKWPLYLDEMTIWVNCGVGFQCLCFD